MDVGERTIAVDGRTIRIDGGALDAGTVLSLAGVTGHAVVIRVDEGTATLFDPMRPLEFDRSARLAFRTFPDGAIHHLRVDGRSWDWGAATIGEDDIRAIGAFGERMIYLEGSDVPLASGAEIDLAVAWPPRIESRDAPDGAASKQVPVVINGRAYTLDRPDVSFEDLVRLAFPDIDSTSVGSRSLTVSYRRGPPERPEGSIVSRQGVRAQKGEVFNVTATDKA